MKIFFICDAFVCGAIGMIMLNTGHITNGLIMYVMMWQFLTMAQNEANKQ